MIIIGLTFLISAAILVLPPLLTRPKEEVWEYDEVPFLNGTLKVPRRP